MSRASEILQGLSEAKPNPKNYEEFASLPGGPGADTIELHVDADNEVIALFQNGQTVELNYDHYVALRKQIKSLVGDGTLAPWPI